MLKVLLAVGFMFPALVAKAAPIQVEFSNGNRVITLEGNPNTEIEILIPRKQFDRYPTVVIPAELNWDEQCRFIKTEKLESSFKITVTSELSSADATTCLFVIQANDTLFLEYGYNILD